MAGIGFELRKAIRSGNTLRRTGGVFSAAFTCFGGMLIGIILLTLIQIAGTASGISRSVTDLFMTYVTNTMFFSMLIASVFSTVLSRFVSDKLFLHQYDEIMPSAIGGSLCAMVGGGALFILFIALSALPLQDSILLLLLYEALSLCWVLMNYIGLLRDYRQITRAFILALLIAGAMTLVLGQIHSMSLYAMILLLTIAYACVDVFLFRSLYRGFPNISGSVFQFFSWMKAFPSLFIVSVSTQVGLLGHFWVTWYTSSESVIHQGLFASCPSYDFPAIVAYFCTVPAMIYFIALFEPDFYERYHSYVDALGNGGNTASVLKARASMVASIRKGLRNYSSIQIISCLLFMTAGSKLLNVINIGMTERMLQAFRMFCVGYSFYSIGSILMLMQMYFVNERKAMLPAAVFAFVTLVLTFVDGRINGRATGIGLCVSSLIYLAIAAIQLVLCLEKLEYHILCESDSPGIPASKNDAGQRHLGTLLNRRVSVGIAFGISLAMIVFPSISFIQQTHRSLYVYHFSPAQSDKVLLSPGMGYAPWANSDEGEEIQTSLVYVELRWADWEPEEGQYNVEYVNEEYRLDTYREQGRQVVFRFICDNPGEEDHIDIPEWLYDATNHDGFHYENSTGMGYSPNYENEAFISAHAKAIEALGNAYGDDDFFCYIELGSLGHWGEYHVNYSEGVPPLPHYDIRNEYIKPYLTAFPHARFMTRYPLVETVKYGFGLYNDMTGDPEETDYWLSQVTESIWEQTGLPEQADTSDAWKTQPIGGEFAVTNSDSYFLHDNLSVTLELLRRSHQSFIGPKIIVNETAVDYSSASREILKTIGYRYTIPEAQADASSEDRILISIEAKNTGIAPAYGAYSLRLTLWDDEDGIAWSEVLQNIQLGKLLPDETQKETVAVEREDLDDDIMYTLTAAIVDERGEAVVPMAIDEEKSPNEYIIGRFTIR